MKKRILSLLLVLLMVASLVPTAVLADKSDTDVAYAVTGGNIYFNKFGKITDCDESVTIANIPAEINGTAVTNIGDYAFSGCTSLTSITIPNNVTSIGGYAFYNCTSLTSITIPDSVTSIGGYAFSGCTGLTSVTIPDSVTSLADGAFNGCTSLTSINVVESNAYYSSNDGVLFNKEKTEIIRYPIGKFDTAYTIPDGVTAIHSMAFSYCDILFSIIMPDSLTSIGADAFNGCTALTSINIPYGVTSIRAGAFNGCTALTSINIPYGVTSISESTFYNCKSLISVNIPDSVTSIGDSAFSNCERLTDVTIPESVTSIGEYAFFCCASLTNVTLPYGLKSIGSLAFFRSGLVNISIPDSVTLIDKRAFSDCYGLESVTLPNGINRINEEVFESCRSLMNITIPDKVNSVDSEAFNRCGLLNKVSLPKSIKVIKLDAFNGCSIKDVYYAGSEAEWKEVSIQAGNESLTSARIHYGGTMESHIYTDVITEPTCTERGYTTHTCTCSISYIDNYTWYTGHSYVDGICTICGAKDPNYVPPHTHDYNAVVTAPTCTEKGYTTYTCSCGDSYKDSYIDALGHDYKNGKCTRCDAEESGSETHTHDYKAVVTEPTCIGAGYTTYTCSCGSSYKDSYTDALGHDYKNGECTRCHAKDPSQTHTHDYKSTVVKATCTEPGYTHYVCSCGDSYDDSYTDALGHRYFLGICIRCGEKEEDGKELHIHSYSSTVIEPTCTEKGYTEWKCECGKSFEILHTDALGHEYKDGLCTRCGAKDPNAHTHIYAEAVTKPTCTEKGYTTYSCTVCGDSYVGSYTNALGHSYANGKCSRCGAADPDYTPPVTMNFVDVPSGSYCYDAVQWAVANGITKGTDSTHFSPNAGCTRAQVVTFMYRAAGEPAVSGTGSFSDVASGSYCYNAVQWAVANGITKGTDSTHFSPNATCTRGQVVTFLYRAQ